MTEREVIYRLRDVATAAKLLRKIDEEYPPERVVGMGFVARGYLDEPEEFYVFVNAKDFTDSDMKALHATMSEKGSLTDFVLDDLWKPPKPHFQTTGPIETIIPMMRAHYPEAGI